MAILVVVRLASSLVLSGVIPPATLELSSDWAILLLSSAVTLGAVLVRGVISSVLPCAALLAVAFMFLVHLAESPLVLRVSNGMKALTSLLPVWTI